MLQVFCNTYYERKYVSENSCCLRFLRCLRARLAFLTEAKIRERHGAERDEPSHVQEARQQLRALSLDRQRTETQAVRVKQQLEAAKVKAVKLEEVSVTRASRHCPG